MPEEELIASIKGEFKPSPRMLLGRALHEVIETPERYRTEDELYRHTTGYAFSPLMVDECRGYFNLSGLWEVKSTKGYVIGRDVVTVVAKVDQLDGAWIRENKVTLGTFDFDKYERSYQWRFYLDVFDAAWVDYTVFCVSESDGGVIDLRSVNQFRLYPYLDLHGDCVELLRQFVSYVDMRGLRQYLTPQPVGA